MPNGDIVHIRERALARFSDYKYVLFFARSRARVYPMLVEHAALLPNAALHEWHIAAANDAPEQSAVFESLVRLAEPLSARFLFIDGARYRGRFGESIIDVADMLSCRLTADKCDDRRAYCYRTASRFVIPCRQLADFRMDGRPKDVRAFDAFVGYAVTTAFHYCPFFDARGFRESV